MAKPFFEVFPTLELKEDLRDMMECTQISKVSTNPKRDAIRIHINSKILIQKDHIFRLERSIKDQLDVYKRQIMIRCGPETWGGGSRSWWNAA